jgi:hypothetical protein
LVAGGLTKWYTSQENLMLTNRWYGTHLPKWNSATSGVARFGDLSRYANQQTTLYRLIVLTKIKTKKLLSRTVMSGSHSTRASDMGLLLKQLTTEKASKKPKLSKEEMAFLKMEVIISKTR